MGRLSTLGNAGYLTCGECGARMVLRNSPKYPNPFYGCSTFPICRGTHGAHADGSPKGTPGDRATREARIKEHDCFDRLWKDGWMSRREAYKWLQKAMSLTPEEAHIGHFTKAQCKRLETLASDARSLYVDASAMHFDACMDDDYF